MGRIQICHCIIDEVYNLSSVVSLAWPERLVVPLYLLSGKHSSRSFSSQSDGKILPPHEKKFIVPF
jgi:hypothetical protein